MELEYITIIQQFIQTVKKRENCIAVTFEDEAYTWEELDVLSDKMAVALLHDEVHVGSHVALCGENSIGWICAFLSVLKVGAIAILLNPKLKEQEVEGILRYADVDYIFYDQVFQEENAEFEKKNIKLKSFSMEVFNHISSSSKLSQEDKDKLQQIKVNPHDSACMLFTSGTTSSPKGVMLSHYQMINIAREATEIMLWTKYDKVCLAIPMFHCFGLSTGLLATFVHGGCINISRGRKSNAVMKCIDENHCTVLNGVPSLFLAILCKNDRENYNLTSLTSGIIAGSQVYSEDFLRIVKELEIEGLTQSYGQTEASPSITFTRYNDSMEVRSKSVGKRISNIQLKINRLDTGEELGDFQVGEIAIKGYNVMNAYYKNDTESKAVLSQDGWLKTGDIGYLDEQGNLYITGRKKEIIIRCGENISPREIEETIRKQIHVSQVKVFGIPAMVVQEEIVACIESSEATVSEKVIRDFLKDKLADYKIPKYIFVYQYFPMNANGKVDIQTLKNEVLLNIKK